MPINPSIEDPGTIVAIFFAYGSFVEILDGARVVPGEMEADNSGHKSD